VVAPVVVCAAAAVRARACWTAAHRTAGRGGREQLGIVPAPSALGVLVVLLGARPAHARREADERIGRALDAVEHDVEIGKVLGCGGKPAVLAGCNVLGVS
jgi:hypothetical protein